MAEETKDRAGGPPCKTCGKPMEPIDTPFTGVRWNCEHCAESDQAGDRAGG